MLQNAPVTPSGLFGDAVESITERFREAQKNAKAMSHFMPRRIFQQSKFSVMSCDSSKGNAPGYYGNLERDITENSPSLQPFLKSYWLTPV